VVGAVSGKVTHAIVGEEARPAPRARRGAARRGARASGAPHVSVLFLTSQFVLTRAVYVQAGAAKMAKIRELGITVRAEPPLRVPPGAGRGVPG
jgi:hypothetical protein